jgi:hypothetical protein
MAITKETPKIQVEILVDGVALPEYNDSDQEQATIGPITRYVEARWGADFAIRYRLYDEHPDSVKIKVSLDGKHIVDKCARVEMFLGSCLKEELHGVKSNEDGL